ncbi:MAG: hypothetical protein JNJ47_07275, partial [Alphaproteobacteria bacterium]|nr:hypothetical protein [Alphaproteobacteria bacterium]
FILFFTLSMNINPGYANEPNKIDGQDTLDSKVVSVVQKTQAQNDVESQTSQKSVTTPLEDTESLVQTKATQNSSSMRVARCLGFSVCALSAVAVPTTLVYLLIKYVEIIIPQINYP